MHVELMINVDNVESSSRWYQHFLGCQSGHGGPDFEMLVDGKELLLMLHRRSAHHHASSPSAGAKLGEGVCIYIRVKDLQAIAGRATQMGLEHAGIRHNDLAHQDELDLLDPDGYFLTVCGPASWASSR